MFAKDAGDAAHLTLAVEPGSERQEIPGKSVEQLQQVGLPMVPVGTGFPNFAETTDRQDPGK